MSMIFTKVYEFEPIKIELAVNQHIGSRLPRSCYLSCKSVKFPGDYAYRHFNCYQDDNYAYLYNLEKRNKKSKILNTFTSNSHGIIRNREKICNPHWIASVYKIPLHLIKNCNQGERTFTIEFI